MERACGFTGDRVAGYAFRTGAALWGFREMGSAIKRQKLTAIHEILYGRIFLSLYFNASDKILLPLPFVELPEFHLSFVHIMPLLYFHTLHMTEFHPMSFRPDSYLSEGNDLRILPRMNHLLRLYLLPEPDIQELFLSSLWWQ